MLFIQSLVLCSFIFNAPSFPVDIAGPCEENEMSKVVLCPLLCLVAVPARGWLSGLWPRCPHLGSTSLLHPEHGSYFEISLSSGAMDLSVHRAVLYGSMFFLFKI